MHIPDGYLSPQTYVPAYGVMIPLWWRASDKLKKTLRNRQVPILALGAAFSFVIMMFNVPPGGHAVGAVLVAILLGPWAAMIAVTLALLVQALMFGDGGVTTFAANCLNMAVLMPFAGWGIYRLLAPRVGSRRQVMAAAAGGYVGLNVAALSTAVMFGVQPIIAPARHALYCPFGLSVAVPAICGAHLLVFGVLEALVTGLVVAYLQRVEPALLAAQAGVPCPVTRQRGLSSAARIGMIVAALVIISPLGLYLPAKFGGRTAWGEWSSGEIAKLAGYVPQALKHPAWHAPMAGYAPFKAQGPAYLVSALVGTALVVLLALGLRRTIWRRKDAAVAAVDVPVNNA